MVFERLVFGLVAMGLRKGVIKINLQNKAMVDARDPVMTDKVVQAPQQTPGRDTSGPRAQAFKGFV